MRYKKYFILELGARKIDAQVNGQGFYYSETESECWRFKTKCVGLIPEQTIIL